MLANHCPTCVCGTEPEPPVIDAQTLIADALELLTPAGAWTQTPGIYPPPDDPLAGAGVPALAMDAYGCAAAVPLSLASYDRAAAWTVHGALRVCAAPVHYGHGPWHPNLDYAVLDACAAVLAAVRPRSAADAGLDNWNNLPTTTHRIVLSTLRRALKSAT